MQASFQLSSEHVSGILLQLIGLAVGSTKQASSNKDEEKEGKTINAGKFAVIDKMNNQGPLSEF